jgi:hypothetical protein
LCDIRLTGNPRIVPTKRDPSPERRAFDIGRVIAMKGKEMKTARQIGDLGKNRSAVAHSARRKRKCLFASHC